MSATGNLVRTEVRQWVADEYRRETAELMKGRFVWKKSADWCEAIAKGLTGASSMFAFAASSNISTKLTDTLAFVSGCIGTLGLVLLTYSSYATRESQNRTAELNRVLYTLNLTPMPGISDRDVTNS